MHVLYVTYVESFMVGSSVRRYYGTIGCTLVVLCDGIMATDHIRKWWHHTAHVHADMCMWAIASSININQISPDRNLNPLGCHQMSARISIMYAKQQIQIDPRGELFFIR